jgi:hypothetical protein
MHKIIFSQIYSESNLKLYFFAQILAWFEFKGFKCFSYLGHFSQLNNNSRNTSSWMTGNFAHKLLVFTYMKWYIDLGKIFSVLSSQKKNLGGVPVRCETCAWWAFILYSNLLYKVQVVTGIRQEVKHLTFVTLNHYLLTVQNWFIISNVVTFCIFVLFLA